MRGIWVFFMAAGLAGCTYVNRPLNEDSVPLEQRGHNATRATLMGDGLAGRGGARGAGAATRPAGDQDGYFVGVAISGGGSRSANFSAACMFQLERLGLLQRVDCISSVSGGSLTAACYCLYDREWNPGEMQRRLSQPFASDLIVRAFMPWYGLAMVFSDYDRTDILADSFRRRLFTREGRALTFADLRADRPRLLINASELQSGQRFVFTDESFDEINSDLSAYPMAYAAAASAAVPVVLHQVTLRDFSTVFRQYRHLIDGGIADNLGVVSLVESYRGQIARAAKEGRPSPYPNGAVLIVIDAGQPFDANLSDKGDTDFLQSLVTGSSLTVAALLSRVGSATMSDIVIKNSADTATAQSMRQQIEQLERNGWVRMEDRDGHPVQVVHLALARVGNLGRISSRRFIERINNIATYFNISDGDAAALYRAADLLVGEMFEQRLRQIADELEGRPATRPAR